MNKKILTISSDSFTGEKKINAFFQKFTFYVMTPKLVEQIIENVCTVNHYNFDSHIINIEIESEHNKICQQHYIDQKSIIKKIKLDTHIMQIINMIELLDNETSVQLKIE